MNSCSVIIVNYNTGKLLTEVVVNALNAQNTDEIIVVDNNSTDGSMELLPNNSKIKKYYRKRNIGFGSSCNYGARKAQSRFLLFLNPDCLIQGDSLAKTLETFAKFPNAGVVGVAVQNPDGTEQKASRRRLPTLWRAIKSYSKLERLAKYCSYFAGVNLSHQPLPIKTQKVEAISGAYIMIKASAFNKIGGFDEGFFMHFEDLDLCKRTTDEGYDILYNPEVQVIHHQGTSSRSNSKVSGKVSHYKKQSLQRYFRKHCALFSYYVIKSISRFLR